MGSPRLSSFPSFGLGAGDASGRRASGISAAMTNDVRRGSSGLPGFQPSPSSPRIAAALPPKGDVTKEKLSDEDSDADQETSGGSITSVD